MFKRWIVGIALVGLVGAFGAQAWGQTPPAPQPHGQGQGSRPGMRGQTRPVIGTIASVSGASFVVTTWGNRSVTVQTTSSTRVLTQQQAAAADLQSGDQVRIVATKAANNSVVAVRVSDTPAALAAASPRGGRGPAGPRGGLWGGSGSMVMITGPLTAGASGGSVTVGLPAGPALAVAVPSSARISRTASLPVSSLAVGTHVAVMGTPAAGGGGATAVTIFVPGAPSH